MIGLVLEGGGTRGAYQIGAIQALLEQGISFDVITGTSIGAINGAMLAVGQFDLLKDLYMNIEPRQVIEASEVIYNYLSIQDFSPKQLADYGRVLTDTLRSGGFDITPLRKLLEENINEQALRQGKVEFGLVTVDLQDYKARELLLPEIPEGELVEYIIASAYLPVFKADKRLFLDGGFANNLPLDLLLRAGEMEHVYIIRTMAMGRHQSLERDVPMTVISPSVSLGPGLLINKERIHENNRMGYFDTLRQVKGLKGQRYYLNQVTEDYFFQLFTGLSDDRIIQLAHSLGENDVTHPKRYLFEIFIPALEKILDLRHKGYEEIGLELFERYAIEQGIERYRILDFQDFEKEIKRTLTGHEPEVHIGLIERLNLFLAKTVRLNWSDSLEIIGTITSQLLGGNDG